MSVARSETNQVVVAISPTAPVQLVQKSAHLQSVPALPSPPSPPRQSFPSRQRLPLKVYQQALEVSKRLSEPHLYSIANLVTGLGYEPVEASTKEAIKLYQEARQMGTEAYKLEAETNPFGTAVATKKGQPRTLGGVFFFLMKEYARANGIDPETLGFVIPPKYTKKPKKPPLPATVAATVSTSDSIKEAKVEQPAPARHPVAIHTVGMVKVSSTVVGNTNTKVLPASAAAPTSPAKSEIATIKPTRTKVVVNGTLTASPKTIKQSSGQEILELVFESEMSETLPKGLPNLGSTRVVVWATPKQWAKVKDEVTLGSTRLLVEGEASAGVVFKDKTAFLKIICTRLTTLEMEQANKKGQAQGENDGSAVAAASPANFVVAAAAVIPATTPSATSAPARAKPTRTKFTIVGQLAPGSQPKIISRNAGGELVELVFDAEMNPNTLPKGLPNLGRVRVVAWATPKQWNKVAAAAATVGSNASGSDMGKLIVEGEVAAAVTRDLEPFLRLVVTRLTTPELEVQSRSAKNL